MNNIELNLLEDKVTKFEGKVYPKFGWCCILAGGPGSGKGYSFNHYVPIQGRKFDVDEIKSFYIKKIKIVKSDLNGDSLVYTDGNNKETVISLDGAGIKPPYNTNNTKYTSLLHQISKPLTKKLKNLIFKSDEYTSADRLPNIIFDCTMSDINDYNIIIPQMKALGYKIAVVYVLTGIDTAIEQNKTRGTSNKINPKTGEIEYGRRVDYDILLNNHNDVYRVLLSIKNEHNLIKQIDDFWAILSKQNGDPTVVNIKEGDHLNFGEISDFINKNTQDIVGKMNDLALSDADNYNESGKLVTGAYDLYEALNELGKLDK